MDIKTLLSLNRTDLGNAQAFYHLYGKNLRYVSTKDRWLVWQGDHWATDDGGYVRNLLRQSVKDRLSLIREARLEDDLKASVLSWLMSCENERRINPAYKVACDMAEMRVKEEDLDVSPWKLGTRGTEIDLETLKPGEPNPASYLTRRLATTYDPDADCPRWKSFLQEIFCGNQELIDFIQVAVGYCLTGSTREQAMFVCVGEGANGKSTFLGTLYKMFGDYAASTPFATFDAKSRNEQTNDLARLKGTRFVTIVETDEDSYLAEQKVKQATGDDPITCRFLHREFFEYYPQFKIWLAANRIPSIKGVDYGIRRRLIIIPFEAKFEGTQRDENLDKKLAKELPGILNWALEGTAKWKETNLHRQIPQRSLDITREYTEDVDHLGNWIKECLVTEAKDEGTAEIKEKAIDLYRCYKIWMSERNHRPKALASWGRDMKSKDFRKKREATGVVYVGVQLRPEALMGN